MRRGPISLRTRFTVSMLAWVLMGLIVLGISATLLFRRHVEGVYHLELQEHLVELVGLTTYDRAGNPALSRPLSDPRYGVPGSGFYWQISRANGETLASPSLVAGRFDDRLAHTRAIVHVEGAGPTGRAMVYGVVKPHPLRRETVHFIIATDVRHLDRIVSDFQRDLVAWLAASGVLLIAGALLALGFATRPFNGLSTRIARVRAGEEGRMGVDWPAEIAPLAADLDRLIESREAMVASARIEAGNLAHGLRTSLAVLTDEAESLAGTRAGQTLLSECRAMTRKLDWHLARARTAAGRGAVIHTDLPDALAPLLAAMERLHATRGIRFAAEGPEARIAIDPEALAEILANLLDNAGKWANSRVDVRWTRAGGQLDITVIDDGPGIPADTAEAIWEPGVRLDEQVPGHGLGLAIARDLTIAAGGRLQLGSRPDGQAGTMAVLTLQAI